jgi:hypothetical protein
MAKNKVFLTVLLALLAAFAVLTGCTEDGMGAGADSGKNATLSETEKHLVS